MFTPTIETHVSYSPKLTFHAWSCYLLDLESKNIGYTIVTAKATIPEKIIESSWKKNPLQKCTEDLVMAAVKAYGGVLEGKHFYFQRSTDRMEGTMTYTVTLYVVEG